MDYLSGIVNISNAKILSHKNYKINQNYHRLHSLVQKYNHHSYYKLEQQLYLRTLHIVG